MKKFIRVFLVILMTFIMVSDLNIQYTYAQDNFLSGQLTGYAELDSKIDSILNQIIQPAMSDEEKVKAVYDHLLFNYEHRADNNITIINMYDPNPLQIVALGASHLFTDGFGVCDDFASAFYVLTTRLGFECNMAGGLYLNRDGSKMPHAWNQIKIGNEWFWVDVDVEGTVYRNQKLDKPLYYLYLKKDEEWKTTHEWDYSEYPSTDKADTPAAVTQPVSAPTPEPQPAAPAPTSQPAPQPAAATTPAPQTGDYSVKLNGVKLDLTLPVLNVGNRLMYPFRECLEAMGASVNWDSNTKVASGTLGNYTVAFTVDSDSYTVNDVPHKMDAGVKTFINNSRTYIPLRYAAEALNFNVAWDGLTQTVLIDSVASDSGELARKQVTLLAEYKKKLPEYEVTMRASDGAIFIDGQQFSYPKKITPAGTTALPSFKTNKMLDGVYPTSWNKMDYVSFAEFNNALAKIGSNQKLQGSSAELALTEFAVKGGDSIVWNNGAVSVGLFMRADSTSPSKAKLSLMAWHTLEEDLVTGKATYEMTEILSTTNSFEVVNPTGFSMDFAMQLWDAMVFLDTALSQEDIITAQESCFLPT